MLQKYYFKINSWNNVSNLKSNLLLYSLYYAKASNKLEGAISA